MTFVVVVAAIKIWLNVVSIFGVPVESPSGVAVAATMRRINLAQHLEHLLNQLFKQKLVK